MNIRVEEKKEIRVTGLAGTFTFDNCQREIPELWQRHSLENHVIHGVYGICFFGEDSLTYMIADPDEGQEGDFKRAVLPAGKWLVFADQGPLPFSIQKTEEEMDAWKSAHPETKIDPSLMVEYYSDPCSYEKGALDEQYAYEVWVKLE